MTGQPHAPKTETFDLETMTNTDPKGYRRRVERYRHELFGLYLARPTPGREQFRYLESWLLPDLGLRVTDFWYNPGYEHDWDLYLDIVSIEPGQLRWQARDLYVDLELRTGKEVAVRDVDELLDAHHAGLVSRTEATGALETAFTTVTALAEQGHDLDGWLASLGITLSWQRR
nr:DUF402 domain-containing protein [Haloechinothrix sp. LS1_15]